MLIKKQQLREPARVLCNQAWKLNESKHYITVPHNMNTRQLFLLVFNALTRLTAFVQCTAIYSFSLIHITSDLLTSGCVSQTCGPPCLRLPHRRPQLSAEFSVLRTDSTAVGHRWVQTRQQLLPLEYWPHVISKTTHFCCCTVLDKTRSMEWASSWSLFCVNGSIFREYMRLKRFSHFRPQWPWH